MYRVIREFCDLKDRGRRYKPGDSYPADGVQVTEVRLHQLSGRANLQGVPLIEWVQDVPAPAADPEPDKPKQKKTRK